VKPMLASKLDFDTLKYPVLVSPKIDGIRAITINGAIYSRSLKLLPNRFIQAEARAFVHGLDGEIVVGSATHPNCMQNTSSGVMSYDGKPDFKFLVFDAYNCPGSYSLRLNYLYNATSIDYHARVKVVKQDLCQNQADIQIKMNEYINAGYEGLMVRSLDGKYKHGRSTVREGYLLKHKIFESEWAQVVGFEEFMHNGNELKTDNLGYAERSSHKDNMVPMNMLGALVVKSPKWPNTFKVGSGFDFPMRKHIWENRELYMSRSVEFVYQPHGVLDVPRMPVFKAFREDMV